MLTDNTRGNGHSVHAPPREARSAADAKIASPRGGGGPLPAESESTVSDPNPNPNPGGPVRREVRREAAFAQVQHVLRGAAASGGSDHRGARSGRGSWRQRGPTLSNTTTNMHSTPSFSSDATATAVRTDL